MSQPLFISDQFIHENTDFHDLVDRLRNAFSSSDIMVPPRQVYNTATQKNAPQLFTMPAMGKENLGVKLVTIHPNNVHLQMPTINGCYVLIDSTNGKLKAILDAKALTSKRTSAVSALATSVLSRQDASALLILGTGPLAKEMAYAHSVVRPISKVFFWGRNVDKAAKVASEINLPGVDCVAVKNYRAVIKKVDIISTATSSPNPLIFGDELIQGQHVDVVGSHKPTQRETDDTAILKSRLFVDDISAALKEAGDVIIPLDNGTISKEHILGDLKTLCSSSPFIRMKNDITLFKSVGLASEDLIAAQYYFTQFVNQ